MNNEEITLQKEITIILEKKLNLKKIYVTGDSNHIKIIAVSNIFKNVSPVERQKMIYKPLISMITNKKIHAVSIVSYTSNEWKINNK